MSAPYQYQTVVHIGDVYYSRISGARRVVTNIYGNDSVELSDKTYQPVYCLLEKIDLNYSRFPQTDAVGGCKA